MNLTEALLVIAERTNFQSEAEAHAVKTALREELSSGESHDETSPEGS